MQKAVKEALASLGASIEDTSVALQNAYAELAGLQAQAKVAEAQLQTAQDNLVKLQREADMIAQRLQTAQDQETSISAQIKADTDRAPSSRRRSASSPATPTRATWRRRRSPRCSTRRTPQTSSSSPSSPRWRCAPRPRPCGTSSRASASTATTRPGSRRCARRSPSSRPPPTRTSSRPRSSARLPPSHKAQVLDLEAKTKAKTAEFEQQKADQLAKQAGAQGPAGPARQGPRGDHRQAGGGPEGRRQEPDRVDGRPALHQPDLGQPDLPDVALRDALPPDLPHLADAHRGRPADLLQHADLRGSLRHRPVGEVPLRVRQPGDAQQRVLEGQVADDQLQPPELDGGARPGRRSPRASCSAYAGTEGTSTGCHLHFEVYLNGSTTDPWPLIAK